MREQPKIAEPKKVLFLSFAPNHSSAISRLSDCRGANFTIETYQTNTDKVDVSISKRIFSADLVKALIYLARSDADAFWCWGLDSCFLGSIVSLLRPNTKIIWDITDINPHLLSKGPISSTLRSIEKLLIRRSSQLFLSSEAFYSEYYRNYIPRERVVVIENLLPQPPPAATPPPPSEMPIVIVYSGIFRSTRVLDVVRGVAEEMSGQVVFHLHGYPDRTIDSSYFDEVIRHKSIKYHGRFNPSELSEIYARAHVSWAMVDPEANDNERWLLNNRIYNGISFSRPVVSTKDTFSGNVVRSRKIGITCGLESRDISLALRNLFKDNMAEYNKLRDAMPPPTTAHLNGEYRAALSALL